MNSNSKLRFNFASNAVNTDSGYWIDDFVMVYDQTAKDDEYNEFRMILVQIPCPIIATTPSIQDILETSDVYSFYKKDSKIDEIPENLIEQEIKILSQGLKEEDIKAKKKEFEIKAKQRIKVGLILNEYGEQNKIKVEESEMQGEIQKQLRMMPGQEKFLMEYYQKNPSAVASLRGNIYEEKIINSIMSKSKTTKKKVGKIEAEKLIKEQNEKDLKQVKEASSKKDDVKQKKAGISKKSTPIKNKTTKKVSKK